MEPLLISFNQQQYDSTVQTLYGTVANMEKIIASYNAMNLGTFQGKDFDALFYNTESFLFEQIMKDKPAEFAGIPINKRKFFDDYLVKPAGYNELIQEIESFKKYTAKIVERNFSGQGLKGYLNYFQISSEGFFDLKDEVLATIKKKNQKTVKTDKAKEGYQLAVAVTDFLNETKSLKNVFTNKPAAERFFGDLFIQREGKFEPNIDFVQSLDHT